MGGKTGENIIMGRVLVTGGGGFLGKAIVKKLLARGEDVTSFSRNHYPELTQLGVSQIAGDIRDQEAVRSACKEKDIVFHVAAKAGVWGNAEEYHDINLNGTRHVIRACHSEHVTRLIYTSSPSVVFDGKDLQGANESVPYPLLYHAPYPASKSLAEQAVKDASNRFLLTVTLRPHLIWGPQDNHLVPKILSRARRLRIIGDGKNLVDTTYIDNAADAHVLAADRLLHLPQLSGKVYFISQGEPVRLWDMVNAILAAGGFPPITKRVSHKKARFVAGWLERTHRFFRLKGEPLLTRFVVDELATSHWFDLRAAREELGYTPRVSTQEGLQHLAQWLKPMH